MIDLTHRVTTEGEPDHYTCSEEIALALATTRLPRSSSLWVLRRHTRTGEESWEFWRVVDSE